MMFIIYINIVMWNEVSIKFIDTVLVNQQIKYEDWNGQGKDREIDR